MSSQPSTITPELVQDNLRIANSLLNFWLEHQNNSWTNPIPRESANLALTVGVQACRLFRSILNDCSRSEGFCASILTRTLFEATLGVAFLLQKDVAIVVEQNTVKPTTPANTPPKYSAKIPSKKIPPDPTHLLSREFRANLVFAYLHFNLEGRGIAALGKYPGQADNAKKLKLSCDPAVTSEFEKQIGPAWSYVLRHSDTPAGLKIKELAEALGNKFLLCYETLYHFQSVASHAQDIYSQITISSDGQLIAQFDSSDSDIYQTLRAATTLFFIHVCIIQENIGFGDAVSTVFNSFQQDFEKLKCGDD